ncbi:hypothetical protein cyc_01596 [Cyclospora cayetanensis]|uniref:CAAX prenyl protease 2/Lysostaphin resistance protein A-like domain-containing protein n=1 Tax=Cyclospora cayetanensis TaxID=88456 RepID=A0A1D3D937_9EIME|nr:hypothetical protein cyc_01596 [Cyclospora cayetanensis]
MQEQEAACTLDPAWGQQIGRSQGAPETLKASQGAPTEEQGDTAGSSSASESFSGSQELETYPESTGDLQHQLEAISVAAGPSSMPSLSLPLPTAPNPRPYDSLWRLLFLVLISCGPFLCMLIFISVLRNVAASMLFLHWICMLGAPMLYVYFASDGPGYYNHVLLCQGPRGGRWRRQGPWACLGFVMGGVGTYVGFRFVWLVCQAASNVDVYEEVRLRLQQLGLGSALWKAVLLAVYFILFNPLVEELFWRVFLYRDSLSDRSEGSQVDIEQQDSDVYVAVKTPPDSPNDTLTTAAAASDTPASHGEAEGATTSRVRTRSKTIAYYDLRVPLSGLVALAISYSSYHMVIFHSLLGAAFVLPSFVLVSLLGGVFLFLRNKERFGLLTATALHAGVDVGVIIVLAEALNVF